jgi:hypothetical protein
MKKVVVAIVACGLFLSSMTAMAKKKKDTQAMQDAKEAQQYGGAKFDGSKVNTSTAVPVGSGKAAPDYKALNKAEKDRQKGAGLDGPKHAPPSPTIKATPPKQAPAAKAAPAKAAAATKPPPKK